MLASQKSPCCARRVTDASADLHRAQSPICSHDHMPTRYARNPTQHSDPNHTPPCTTRDPVRIADLCALRADLQYLEVLHAEPRSPPPDLHADSICPPSRSALRSDLPAEPFCTPTRSARRFAIFTSRDLLAYRCTPIVCFDPTRSARRAELHTEPICTPTRSAFVLRPDLLSTRSAVDPICT